MRKNFLILTLLTLLPFYGWATDYTVEVRPKPASATYGEAFTLATSDLVITGAATNDDVQSAILGKLKVKEAFTAGTDAGSYSYSLDYRNSSETSVTAGSDTYTITIPSFSADLVIGKADPTVTAPVAATLETYNGSAQILINAGSTTGGTLQYKVGDGTYSEDLPTGTDAGEYTVYYKVVGNSNYNDVAEASLSTITIAKATPTVTAPTAATLEAYNGSAQILINAGSTTGGTLQYKVGDGTYSEDLPTGTDAGEYTVYYKVVGNSNYNDVTEQSLTAITIEKAQPVITADNIQINAAAVADSYVYTADMALVPGYDGTIASDATPYYRFSKDGGSTWATPETTTFAKGESWLVGCGVVASSNYKPAFASKGFTIGAGTQEWETALNVEESYVYSGSAPAITTPTAKYESAVVTLTYYNQGEDVALGSAPTTVGDYTVKATAAATTNYDALEATANYSITAANSKVATAPTAKTGLTYTGADQALVNAGTATNGTMKYSLDGETWSDDVPTAKDAGDYTVSYKVVGNANYNDVEAATLSTISVSKAGLSYALANKEVTYDGNAVNTDDTYTLFAGSFATGEDLATTGITFDFPEEVKNAGTYNFDKLTVNYNGNTNYNILFTGTSIVTVEPKAFTADMITGFAASKAYTGEAQNPGYTVKDGDPSIISEDDYDVAVAPAEVIASGEYTYTFTPKNNYTGEAIEKSFTISGKALAESMLQGEWSAAATYDGTDKAPASISLKDGEEDLTAADYEVVITNTKDEDEDGANDVVTEAVNADTYTFTFTGKANYTGSFTKTLVIAPKALAAADFALAAETAEYNGYEQKPAVTTELTDADYTLAINGSAETVVKDVNTYTFAFTGKGNYQGTVNKSYEITKATVLVSATSVEKNYDGNAEFGTDKPEYEYSGLLGDDDATAITAGTDAISIEDAAATVGTYNLIVDASGFSSANYVIAANEEVKGTFKINAVNLAIAFKEGIEIKKGYGQDDPEFDASWKTTNIGLAGNVAADADAIYAGITVTRTNADVEEKGEYDGVLAISYDGDIFSNYNVAVGGNADFEITSAVLQIALKDDLTKVYDGQAPEAITVAAADLAVSGYQNDDDISVITTLPRATIVDAAADQGTYVIKLDGAEAANYEFQYVDARYVITPKELTATVNPQTVKVGATELSQVEGVDYTIGGAVEGDELNAELSINGSTATAGEIANGIALNIDNANYTLTATYGKLIVIDGSAILLSKTNDNTEVIEGAEGTATVTFDNFELAADRWYAMVLPFETSTVKLSQAFGYAVVDVLDKTNDSDSKVRFKLNMGTINANQPFVFKLAEAKNMNAVTFSGVTIEAPAADADLIEEDAAGNQFIGTYAGVTIASPDKDYIISIGDGDIHPAAAGAKVRPLGAYIKTVADYAAAPVFEIEEIDGSVTTVKAIEAVKAVSAEGWYTVNGVKLNAAPAQKGVYIKDGKKVVIK